ncbi:MAG: transglutaminase domain-containing protein [Clostridia bacterium]|nr:transglutaminase domain-containing protein [Clostridia bacterium]
MSVPKLIGRAAVLTGLLLMLWVGVSANSQDAVWPERGKSSKSNGKLVLDVTHMEDGYVMAGVKKQSKKRLKLRITKGKETLTYDLNNKGEMEVFPLQMGSGKYSVSLFENVSGKKYSQAGKISISPKLTSEDAAFLAPNQYVNYTRLSAAVAKSDELCAGKSGQDAAQAVVNFMKSSFMYDYIRAATVTAGMLPDIDGSFEKRMGICQDLSAITCCLMRVAGVPCKMAIGYADKQYHAWTLIVVDGKEKFFDPTAAISAIAKPRTYTIERMY